jgi:VWFA-related protein
MRKLTALLVLATSVVAGQQPPPPQTPPQPTFRVEANYVRVDVYPTLNGRIVSDLTRDDFEILEDGVAQKVDSFVHVVARAPGPQSARVDPNSVEQMRQMAADPRSRLFVLFLDTHHTAMASSRMVSPALVRLLQRTIGQDDLIAAMTPLMSAKDITFARHTGALEELLAKQWWGKRDSTFDRDPVEQSYEFCFDKQTAEQLIARRREKQLLDALQDLVVHLRGVREERKAVFVISEGWRLYGPDQRLAASGRPGDGIPNIGIGPTGKLTTKDPRLGGASRYECERDLQNLAMLENERQFLDILGDANRANVSFYPVDPRGLPAVDSDISAGIPVHIDQRNLGDRLRNLRTLADATDGIPVMNSNDIVGGLQRVVDDLASYYLLGYYSTNTKLDGKFRNIKVRVKRPGVDVRARRGYRASTREELAKTNGAGTGASAPTAPSAVEHALGRLAGYRPETKFHVAGGAVPASGEEGTGSVWVVGELDFTASRQPDWAGGGEADIVVSAGNKPVASTKVTLPAGARTLVAKVPMTEAVTADNLRVSVRLRPMTSGLPVQNVAQIDWPKDAAAAPPAPMLFRRGPSTGLKYDPTADYRFRRNERVRVQVPVVGAEPTAAGRMLDRAGQPLQVPVTTTVQRDAHGASVIAEVALAPLAAGDYAIEVTLTRGDASTQQHVLLPVRVIP